jgi:type I restriction enzyme R subunit
MDFLKKNYREKFASDEYQLLLVADKYQTGFDQPFTLHTMYVDKNFLWCKSSPDLVLKQNVCAGKEDTFVLDFTNDTEDILNSFQPYYELTSIKRKFRPESSL